MVSKNVSIEEALSLFDLPVGESFEDPLCRGGACVRVTYEGGGCTGCHFLNKKNLSSGRRGFDGKQYQFTCAITDSLLYISFPCVSKTRSDNLSVKYIKTRRDNFEEGVRWQTKKFTALKLLKN